MTLLLALVASAAGCHRGEADAKDAAGADSAAVKTLVDADVATAGSGVFAETVTAPGIVTARPGQLATLSATAQARVTSVTATPGQAVHRGDTLVALDRTPFMTAASSAAATLQLAAQGRERAQRLVTAGIAARRDLEQADAELARARADDAAARRNVELAVIRSPISGVVTAVHTSLGATADPAQPLVDVVDLSTPDVVLSVTADDAARLHPGDRVRIGNSASPADTLGSGVVVDIAGAVDSASHAVLVRARIGHAVRPLRLGESVSATITTASHQHAVTVPVAALIPDGDLFKVFVVDSAGVAHATSVTVGSRNDSVVEIRDGLPAGARVVTRGAFGVDEGARIGKAKP